MNYDPIISAAKREAKKRARTTGVPYQTALQQVAREAGTPDWGAFLQNPAPIPPTTVLVPPPTTPDIQLAMARRSGARRRIACIVGAMTAATIPVAAAAAILLDSDRMNEESSRVAAEATMLAHVHAPLVGFAETRTFPARIEIPEAQRRIVTLAFTDMRVAGASRFLRYLPGHEPIVFVGDQLGGRLMRDALSRGAVMRLVVEVDCKAATTRYLRYEAARDMTSAPIFMRTIPGAGLAHPITSASSLEEVCKAPATPPIHID